MNFDVITKPRFKWDIKKPAKRQLINIFPISQRNYFNNEFHIKNIVYYPVVTRSDPERISSFQFDIA
jgi:hypothetical protein